jgi:hypothetical protein
MWMSKISIAIAVSILLGSNAFADVTCITVGNVTSCTDSDSGHTPIVAAPKDRDSTICIRNGDILICN